MTNELNTQSCTPTFTREPNPHANAHKTDVTIEVIATPGGPEGVTYRQEIKQHGKDGKLDLPRNSGPYRIHFDLDVVGGLDLRFDAAGPIFCAVDNGKCPTSIATDQIMVERCDKNDLIVVDWNYGDEQALRYQLNFVNKAGAKLPCFDPIILNGGGKITL